MRSKSRSESQYTSVPAGELSKVAKFERRPLSVTWLADRSLSILQATTGFMDVQEDPKVAERAVPTKFEKREWFLENLRLLLSLDLNQDPSDEDSRSERLRLHSMEAVVSDCTRFGIASVLIVCPSFLCADE